MFCLKCGKEIPDFSEFCHFCGAAQDGDLIEKDQEIVQEGNNTGKKIGPKVVKDLAKEVVAGAAGGIGEFVKEAVLEEIGTTANGLFKKGIKTIKKSGHKARRKMGIENKNVDDYKDDLKRIFKSGLDRVKKKTKRKKS